MLQNFREYIKYCRTAKKRHGIHSPFVYALGDKCLAIPVPQHIIKEAIRLKKSTISSSPFHHKKYISLFYQILYFYRPEKALIFGSDTAITQLLIKESNPTSKVTFVPSKNTSILSPPHNSVSFEKTDRITYNLIFIDIQHFISLYNQRKIEELIQEESMIILTEIRSSKKNLQLWKRIISNHYFHLTIDFFRWGIIMVRSHQQKEHFILHT